MTRGPVISAAVQVLAHVPGMARHGSKPQRELARDPSLETPFRSALRSFAAAVAYAPHQAFIGAMHPRALPERPWATPVVPPALSRFAPDGEIMPETEFLGLLAAIDEFGLLHLEPDVARRAATALEQHPLAARLDLSRIGKAAATGHFEPGALPLCVDHDPAGFMMRAHDQDESLSAGVLLENLCSKGTATLALLHLLEDRGIDPGSIDYVLGCGEEAIGDRYQRGGGNLAKAVAQSAGLTEASGADVKDFCAAPVPALVIAASLVSAGVFKRVAVIAGGSLAKLGMKFQGHLAKGFPVLEDVLGGAAALVEADDGRSPAIRLDAIGRHRVAAGGSNQQIMEALAVEPLARVGLPLTAVDDYATELHNPEVTETAGSGNVPDRNYRTIAALAVRSGAITRDGMGEFVRTRGMPGFAPTQGHLASALCYLPHALRRLTCGEAERALLIAKGSLFLGRMCQLSDGMSVLLEASGTRKSERGTRN